MSRARLRPTMADDLDFVLSLQHDPAHRSLVTQWERSQHEAATRFPDFRHFIIEGGAGLEAAGFAVLTGCRNPHRSIELKHMVVQPREMGVGRAAIRVLKKLVFDELGAHRFWLELNGENARAQSFCDNEGFVLEGRLRDAVRARAETADDAAEYHSLVILSMLQQEFAARRAQGLEMFG
ncbi:MAG TPA: GNAT family protein [Burkholderiaceae bacterium]|nr:GNAT family protein [Burkholderiaceae bacterium]